MKNLVTEKDLPHFMSLKVPQKGIGFYTDDYSGNQAEFIKGLEGEMEYLCEGYICVVPKTQVNEIFSKITTFMEDNFEDSMEMGDEFFLAQYDLPDDQSLLVVVEFGGSDPFIYEVETLTNNAGFRYNRAAPTVEGLSDVEITLPIHYQQALRYVKK